MASSTSSVTEALKAVVVNGPPVPTSDRTADLVGSIPDLHDKSLEESYLGEIGSNICGHVPLDEIEPKPAGRNQYGTLYNYSRSGGPTMYGEAFGATVSVGPPLDIGINWNEFSIAEYTEAMRTEASIPVNTAKLDSDLKHFRGLLEAKCGTLLQHILVESEHYIFALKFRTIRDEGKVDEVRQDIFRGVTSTAFISNFNMSLAQGGDSASKVTFMLYFLFMFYEILDGNTWDSLIVSCQRNGMNVPFVLSKPSWKQDYVSWFVPFSNSTLVELEKGNIHRDFVMNARIPGSPLSTKYTETDGYAKSFCLWSKFAEYK